MNNVEDHLVDGGYFIATYLDGQKVFNKLSESPNGQIPEDSDIWKIIRKYQSDKFEIKNPYESFFSPTLTIMLLENF